MNRFIFFFSFVFFVVTLKTTLSYSQVFENEDEAFACATTTTKNVLLVFSGSDWCAPCVQLEKQILSKSTFQDFANRNLVVLKADFPQRKKLPKNIQEQNDALADRYNPTGLFPEIILLRPDKSVVKIIAYTNQSTEEFIAEIKPYLSK